MELCIGIKFEQAWPGEFDGSMDMYARPFNLTSLKYELT